MLLPFAFKSWPSRFGWAIQGAQGDLHMEVLFETEFNTLDYCYYILLYTGENPLILKS